jgi:hypothetical protein
LSCRQLLLKPDDATNAVSGRYVLPDSIMGTHPVSGRFVLSGGLKSGDDVRTREILSSGFVNPTGLCGRVLLCHAIDANCVRRRNVLGNCRGVERDVVYDVSGRYDVSVHGTRDDVSSSTNVTRHVCDRILLPRGIDDIHSVSGWVVLSDTVSKESVSGWKRVSYRNDQLRTA